MKQVNEHDLLAESLAMAEVNDALKGLRPIQRDRVLKHLLAISLKSSVMIGSTREDNHKEWEEQE